MASPRFRLMRPLALVALLGGLVVGASALAAVAIYKNDFSSRAEFKEVKRAGGKRCERGWREKSETMRIAVTRGPEACAYEPPVRGDRPKPDHDFQAEGKVLPSTAKRVREKAYLAISVRVGGGKSYELRVFPKGERYQLRREPDGAGFPAEGTSNAIRGIGDRNELRLRAFGSKVRAKVNDTEVANVTDGGADQLEGAKLEFALGHTGSSGKDAAGSFDKLKLSVPNR